MRCSVTPSGTVTFRSVPASVFTVSRPLPTAVTVPTTRLAGAAAWAKASGATGSAGTTLSSRHRPKTLRMLDFLSFDFISSPHKRQTYIAGSEGKRETGCVWVDDRALGKVYGSFVTNCCGKCNELLLLYFRGDQKCKASRGTHVDSRQAPVMHQDRIPVPEVEGRQIVRQNLLDLHIVRLPSLLVGRLGGIVQQSIQLRVSVAAAIRPFRRYTS